MSEQIVVGTDVALPRQLVLHTLGQGSWPWTFDFLIRAVERQRTVPVDPVLLFWPLHPDLEPAFADAEADLIHQGLLDPDSYELRLVGRRVAEDACRRWPDTRDLFSPMPEPEPTDELKPVAPAVPRERRSPFDRR